VGNKLKSVDLFILYKIKGRGKLDHALQISKTVELAIDIKYMTYSDFSSSVAYY